MPFLKVIFILIFIGFGSGSVSSFAGENLFSDGVALFNAGDFQASYDHLLKAFEHEPENLDLNFYLGRAAFETGQYEMAIMAFERILISSPRENRVKLEMARAFQKLGANNTAIQYCLEVLASNPPEAVKNNIQSFLAHIKKTEQTHFLNGQLSAGIDWNNNIWASP
ncbi:MAG: tetratricopeptide repeat protein, partial [Desulfobacteraceae bacterium]|nr:tetratricopeptide repeat protein [Desulfobacteraceae bacterium]